MKLIEKDIEQIIKNTVKKVYGEIDDLQEVLIQSTANEKFGDFQTNFAMVNSKVLKCG